MRECSLDVQTKGYEGGITLQTSVTMATEMADVELAVKSVVVHRILSQKKESRETQIRATSKEDSYML